MTIYIHAFRCKVCGNRFELKRKTAEPPKHPKCPRKGCQSKRVRESHMPDVGMDVSAGKAPAQVGSTATRAMDIAMEVGAANSGLTDLNDRARYGENMAPKLAPRLQRQADSFFGGGRVPGKGKRRVQVDLSGALAPFSQNQAPTGAPAVAVDPRSFLPAGKRGASPVPSYTAIAGD